MTENAKNPAAQNPSKADASYEYELAWKGFNHISVVVNVILEWGTYEQAIQDKLRDIQQYCTSTCQNLMWQCGYGMYPSEGAKRIAPLAEQLQASADPFTGSTAECIAARNKNMGSLASQWGI